MQLENTFSVPVPVDQAWGVLLDVHRVAPCMPGATLESVDGDEFTGNIRVKVGPISMSYRGSARFTERDSARHVAVIEASGNEARGSGTARARVTTTLSEEGGSTTVRVSTDLTVTGRPAQFGRGVMADVSAKLIDQFAACLAREVAGGARPGAPEAGASEAAPPAKTAPAKSEPAKSEPAKTAPEKSAPAKSAAAKTAPAKAAAKTAPAKKTASAKVGEPEAEAPPSPPPAPQLSAPPRPPSTPALEPEPINLLDLVGVPLLKRAAPGLAALVLLIALLATRRRRRHRSRRRRG